MDFDDIGEMMSHYDDNEFLERLEAMVHFRDEPLSRLAQIPTVVEILRAILDRAEEDGARDEGILDKIRDRLHECRSFVVEDLQKARQLFEEIQRTLAEKGHNDLSVRAKLAVEQLIAMQQSQRVQKETVQELEDLYSDLLSRIKFEKP